MKAIITTLIIGTLALPAFAAPEAKDGDKKDK